MLGKYTQSSHGSWVLGFDINHNLLFKSVGFFTSVTTSWCDFVTLLAFTYFHWSCCSSYIPSMKFHGVPLKTIETSKMAVECMFAWGFFLRKTLGLRQSSTGTSKTHSPTLQHSFQDVKCRMCHMMGKHFLPLFTGRCHVPTAHPQKFLDDSTSEVSWSLGTSQTRRTL